MRSFLSHLWDHVCRSSDARRRRNLNRSGLERARTESLECRQLLAADFQLLRDIHTTPNQLGSEPELMTTVGSTAFFRATSVAHGAELWKSDGTSEGTVLVKDIRPGRDSSYVRNLVNVNGTLFFTAASVGLDTELWKSDGTESGTVLIKRLPSGSYGTGVSSLTNLNGTLFFAASDSANGLELWRSDGTAAGTLVVKDIRDGVGHSNPRLLTNVNGKLFFSADDGVNGDELWMSDGTPSGTVLVRDIRPGTGGSFLSSLTNVGGTLYFAGYVDSSGTELWSSNGTTAGTMMVKDIRPGTDQSDLTNLTNVNGSLYFSANDGTGGSELWRSDGTGAGTLMVRDIHAGTLGSELSELTNVNGTLYFSAFNGTNGIELWKSDGTAAGTDLIKDISPGAFSAGLKYLTNVNGTLFFRANDGLTGHELWKSDGSAAGTVLVRDIIPPLLFREPANYLTNVNGTLFFQVDDGVHGPELWRSDGTEVGTLLVRDIQSGTESLSASWLTNSNGTLYFVANNRTNGSELWRSDGTTAGTTMVRDIRGGAYGSVSSNLEDVNGIVYFGANDGTTGEELWRSDGTESGTRRVKEINPGPGSGYPRDLINVNGTLYFNALEPTNGSELWKSDGTDAGTVLVKDINPGTYNSLASEMTDVSGTLYFRADDGVHGRELWKTDGTPAGTVLVKDIVGGSFSADPMWLTNVNGTLYFSVIDEDAGRELWKSDGTEAGTVLVRNIRGGGQSSYPNALTNVNGVLFFRANDGTHGYELWKSDGTTAGTVLVKEVSAGTSNSFPADLTNVNGTLYFSAFDEQSGIELWKSDGTASGTVQVADIFAGTRNSNPRQLTNVNGTLYFNGRTANNGYELWKSDGTVAGTVIAYDFTGDSGGGDLNSPGMITAVGDLLFVVATSEQFGMELFVRNPNTVPAVVTLDPSTLAENLPTGTTVGVLSTSESTLGKSYTYRLVIGEGNTDNSRFAIVGDSVVTDSPLDFEEKSVYSIRVRSTDQDGISTDAMFAVTVTNVNDVPEVILQNIVSSLPEFSDTTLATKIADIQLTDDALGTNVLSLSGADSDKFEIVGSVLFLKAGTPLSFITKSSFDYTVEVNDASLSGNPDASVNGQLQITSAATAILGPTPTSNFQRPTITWAPVPGAVKYEVWIRNQSTVVNPFLQATRTSTAFYPSQDLGIGRYNLWVRAIGPNNVKLPWTPQYNFQIATPLSVNSLNPVQTTLRPTITWAALPGAHHYDVWINNLSTGATQVVRNMNVSGTSFQVPSNLAIGNYRAWVGGVATDGFAATWSPPVNFRVAVPPTVTQGQSASFNRTPVLQWNPLPGVSRYDVWIDNLSTGAAQVIRNVNVTPTTFTGPTTLPIGNYRAWVRGIAADGFTTAWTSAINFRISGAPVVTQGLNSTFDRTPTFAWNAVPGASSYEVYLSNLSTGATTLHEKNLTATHFTTPTLTDGSYRWWAIGVTAQGFRSLWTTPMDIFVGGRPSFLTPSGTTSDTTPTFSWKPVDGVDRYDLWVDRLGGATQVIRQQLLTVSSYTPANALPSGNYRAWVRAVSSTGEISVWSVPLHFTIAESSISPFAESKLLPLLTSTIRPGQIVEEVAVDRARNRIVDPDREAVESTSIPSDARKSAVETEDAMFDKVVMKSLQLWFGGV